MDSMDDSCFMNYTANIRATTGCICPGIELEDRTCGPASCYATMEEPCGNSVFLRVFSPIYIFIYTYWLLILLTLLVLFVLPILVI